MRITKTIVLSAAMAAPFIASASTYQGKNIYIEVQPGYARQNYLTNENWRGTASGLSGATGTGFNNNGNVTGGFSAGIDAGYRINKNFGIELGWFYLPDVNVMQTRVAGQTSAYMSNWALYLAGKYIMPIEWMNNTELFFKLGAEYRSVKIPPVAQTGYAVTTDKSTYVRPMFATGLDYQFNSAWSGLIQYAYFMGANNSFPSTTAGTGSLGTVAANVFTLGLGYHFAV